MRTKSLKSLGLNLSLSALRILRGISAQKVVIVEMNFFYRFLNFFGFLYLSLEEFSKLYFYLPVERFSEISTELKKIADDFISWKRFFELNRYSAKTLKDMALNEMSKLAKTFQQANDGFRLSFGNIVMEEKFLEIMELHAVSFEEKMILVKCRNPINEERLDELLPMIKTFLSAEQFVSIVGVSQKYKNKGLKKMLDLASSYRELIRTHRRVKPGSPLRRLIVSEVEKYEMLQEELLQSYYEEKNWSRLKRMLYGKIEKLVLGIEDWIEILLKYGDDKKLKNLAMSKMRQLGLGFDQLNNTLARAKDPEVKEVILEEMLSLAEGIFDRLTIVAIKSDEFPQIFGKAFLSLVDIVQTLEESKRICEILTTSKNKNNSDFISRILKLDVDFSILEKLFVKSSKEGKELLIPTLYILAKGNFDNLSKTFDHSLALENKDRKKIQTKCLRDVFSLEKESNDLGKLIRVYNMALIIGDFQISEKIVNTISKLEFDFKTLLTAYENLEKLRITNNGLAKFLQTEMISKAQTEEEKRQAFIKAPIQIQNIALTNLLGAA